MGRCGVRSVIEASRGSRSSPRRLAVPAILLVSLLALTAWAEDVKSDNASALPRHGERPSVGDLVRRGGLIMVPIGICSVFLVASLLERLAAMRRRRIIPPEFLAELHRLRDADRLRPDTLEALCKRFPSPMSNVVKSSLLRLGHPLLEVEKVMEDAAARELSILRAGIRPLTAIASIAPLLGLVGTVFGMIDAFIVTSQPGLKDRTELLAGGIYEALVATAAGLLVAVPALIAAYYFTGRLDRLAREMGDALTPLVPALARLEQPTQAEPPKTAKFW
jgi:biopolymer transport protein ExbB